MRCIASLKTTPMMPCKTTFLNSKSTKNDTSHPSSVSANDQLDFIYLNGPSKYSVSSFLSSGHKTTRLPKRSRNTLNEITKSASITWDAPSGVTDLIRAAEHHGKNFG